MRPGQRFGFSAIEKRDVWNRWKAGQSLHEIGRAFDKPHSCIRSVLLPRGGISPAARRRSRLALTLAEREDISRGIASGSSMREMARRLDRAASTVSREVARLGAEPEPNGFRGRHSANWLPITEPRSGPSIDSVLRGAQIRPFDHETDHVQAGNRGAKVAQKGPLRPFAKMDTYRGI